jgi:murein DD-endopeptidase MepM/ murein hydrolase activator NlpD
VRGLTLFERPDRCSLARRATALALVAAAVLAVSAPQPSLSADEVENAQIVALAPTAAGAPFLPSSPRSDTVLARADLLERMDRLSSAQRLLWTRTDTSETRRILESQHAALSRALESIQAIDLTNAAESFNIDVGVFPVDELRKPFSNDWDEPRSGGRRHRGTDLLAQMGVPLRAIEDGTFERSTVGSLGGLSVYLLGDSGARYYYAHLDRVESFEERETVYAGQMIGTVGDSGNARGSPHLHIQWAPNGDSDWENPYPLLAALYGAGRSTDPRAYGPPNALA